MLKHVNTYRSRNLVNNFPLMISGMYCITTGATYALATVRSLGIPKSAYRQNIDTSSINRHVISQKNETCTITGNHLLFSDRFDVSSSPPPL
jgi:hypothetical protein